MTTKLLITGGTGFVGSGLLRRLADEPAFEAVAAVRSTGVRLPGSVSSFTINSIGKDTDWSGCLDGVEVVIHCAARAHVIRDKTSDPWDEFRTVNVDGTLNFARQAAAAGVRRFVFISSVKVNGEGTGQGKQFRPDDVPAPEDFYGASKLEAEIGLKELCRKNEMELVIIRPPLVYGPGVKGNFRTLIKLARLPIPLPFGRIRNQRSMVYLDNLVDFVLLASEHPAAASETFIVSDGDDLSTTRLLRLLRQGLRHRPLLIPVPEGWLQNVLSAMGKAGLARRLMGSLQVDSGKARTLLGWVAPYSVETGILKTVADDLHG